MSVSLPSHARFPLPCRLSLAVLAALSLSGLDAQAGTEPVDGLQQASATKGRPAAADAAVSLNRVVVTAQKREQQIMDVPTSISAYSGEFIQKYGLYRMEDLGRYVSGVQIQVQSVNTPSMAIRGITQDDTSSNTPPRVSVYQDGVDISRATGSTVALFDLDRVEVLKGPQGTLFGRGAESGALSLVSHKAEDKTSGGFTSEFGNYGSRMLTGFFNTPISSNVDVRLAAYDARHDGYIRNTEGGSLNGEDTKALRLSLHFRLGEHSSYDVLANYQRDSPPGTAFRSKLPNVNGSTNLWGAASLSRIGYDGNQLGIRRKIYSLTGLGSFRLNDDWTLSTITGLRRFNSVEQFDADGSQLDILNFSTNSTSSQASQEVRFNFDNGGRFTGFFGADVFYENGHQGAQLQTNEQQLLTDVIPIARQLQPGLVGMLFGPSNPSVLNGQFQPNTPYTSIPLLGIPLNTDEREAYANYGSTRSYELFGDGTWHVSDFFDLTVGARVSREMITSGYQVFNATDRHAATIGPALAQFGTGLNGMTGPNNLFAPTYGKLVNRTTATSAVGRIIGSFHLDEQTNAYVSVSRGRRPPALQFNVNANGSYTPVRLPAESLMNYELGVKGEAEQGRFAYDLAAFYYQYNNFQSNVYQQGRYVAVNSGRANAPGFEASLQQALTSHLSAFLNYSYLHARFADKDNAGNRQEYAGNHLRLAPDHSAAFGLNLALPISGSARFYVRPSYTWRSKVWFEDNNHPSYTQGAYGLVNLRMGVSFAHDHWDVGLFGANLNGKKYLIDAGNTGEQFNLATYIPGSPRTYGVSISGRF